MIRLITTLDTHLQRGVNAGCAALMRRFNVSKHTLMQVTAALSSIGGLLSMAADMARHRYDGVLIGAIVIVFQSLFLMRICDAVGYESEVSAKVFKCIGVVSTAAMTAPFFAATVPADQAAMQLERWHNIGFVLMWSLVTLLGYVLRIPRSPPPRKRKAAHPQKGSGSLPGPFLLCYGYRGPP